MPGCAVVSRTGANQEVYALELREETDVFASRHAGREVAATIGITGQDLVRIATALSEVSRDVLVAGGGAVSFMLLRSGVLRVVITTTGTADQLPTDACSVGIEAARRLLGSVEVRTDVAGHTVITIEKTLASVMSLTPADQEGLRRRLAGADRNSLDELRDQNRELMATLEEVQAQRDELETTNQGVMALYAELSGELETTNQGVVALYAEIDDKSRQLREASDSKTRFLHNISHELRTPGNSVLGLARLLLDPDAEPLGDEQRQQVELISACAQDLLRLVNELLDLAKAESGRIEPTVEDVDLTALFDELRGTTVPLISRPEVRLVVKPPRGLGPLRSDPTLVRHVLRNLLSNAVKFTERGDIVLRASQRADRLRVSVADSGIGIAEEDQPRVFEEFYQVRSTLQSQVKGSGLGLPFARRIARILGGDLTLHSTPGEGATFVLELPVRWPSAAADGARA